MEDQRRDRQRGHQMRNVQTNKCLTIAGGVSTDNNVTALQFNSDTNLSRRWTIRSNGACHAPQRVTFDTIDKCPVVARWRRA